jgi:hypothetical protein
MDLIGPPTGDFARTLGPVRREAPGLSGDAKPPRDNDPPSYKVNGRAVRDQGPSGPVDLMRGWTLLMESRK